MNVTLAKLTQLTNDPRAATDAALIDAFLAGDQGAFAVLVRRHAALVFATCRSVLGHQQDAEDAFQATFLVLARRAADVWPRESVGAWLFGVARRVALKARTARARRAVCEPLPSDVASAKPLPPDFDLAESVHRVVLKLPEVYRAAVVACDLEGLSRKEAAERLGWSEGTLSGRLARARELLAARFRRLGLTLPAGGLATACAVPQSVSAHTVQTAIDLATETSAVGVSAPVAALTEGVVRSMALVKLKAMTAAAFVACAIGFGALAAGPGFGDDPDGQKQTQTQGPAPPAAKTPPAKAADQIDRLIEASYEQPAKAPTAKPVTDRDRLQGTWRVVSLTEGDKSTPTSPKDPWVIEVSSDTLKMPYFEGGTSASGSTGSADSGSGSTTGTTAGGWKQRTYTFAVDETKTPRTIDLTAKNAPVGRGIYQFAAPAHTCSTCHQDPFGERRGLQPVCETMLKAVSSSSSKVKLSDLSVWMALSIDGKRPEKFGGAGVIVFELRRAADAPKPEDAKPEVRVATAALHRAQEELAQAEAELEVARARAEQARNDVDRAFKKRDGAQDRLKAAEKAVADATAKPKAGGDAAGGAVFTVHIRTLTAPEKVIRVKLTSNTVLDGLVHAADDVSIKSDGLSVWVVRDKTVMPVDLVGITKNGDTKTNYVLKAGDQLFVQVKPAK